MVHTKAASTYQGVYSIAYKSLKDLKKLNYYYYMYMKEVSCIVLKHSCMVCLTIDVRSTDIIVSRVPYVACVYVMIQIDVVVHCPFKTIMCKWCLQEVYVNARHTSFRSRCRLSLHDIVSIIYVNLNLSPLNKIDTTFL